MVDFDWYRSFVAIYRMGTVTRAAKARLMTQPAVSQHLAALEAALGDQLFKREPRRMVATERGKEVYARIAQSIDTLELLGQQALGANVDEPPLVRLGTPAEYFAAVAVERMAGLVPRLWVHFAEAKTLLDSLAANDLDLVIATQRLATQGIVFDHLMDEHFLLIGPPEMVPPDGLGAASDSSREMEDWLSSQPWISYGVELPIVRRFWQQVFRRRPQFSASLVVPDLRTILGAVESGFGISLVPDYLCRDAIATGRVRILWTPEPPITNELWLAYRQVDRNDVEIERVRSMLRR